MSTYLYSLARRCHELGWRVLVAWVVVLVAAAALGLGLGKGTNNDISIPGVESQQALDDLSRIFPAAAGTTAQTVVKLPDGTTVDDPSVTTAIQDAAERQKHISQVSEVISPFDEMASGGVSQDRAAAIIIAQYEVQDTAVTEESRNQLKEEGDRLFSALPDGAQVSVGGDAFADRIPTPSATELLGILLAFIVLYVLFRSFTTAFVPLATALVGVGVTEMLLEAATGAIDIMATAPMLALMIGLAVGIDYALFIVSRYRDELMDGRSYAEAAAVATGTAGSAVVFAGVTVVIALLGLFVAGIPFLTVMGVSAALGVAVAVAVAVTAIPALLRYLKDLPVRRLRTRSARHEAQENSGQSAGTRWVGFVTRHPLAVLVVGLVVVGGLAWPAQSLQLSLPGNSSEPVGNEARDTYDLVSEEFGEGFNGPLVVTVNLLDSTDPVGDMDRLGDDLGKVDGVETVAMSTPEPTGSMGFVQLIPTSAVDSPETTELVHRLRDQRDRVEETYPFRDYAVTGVNAVQVDVSQKLGDAMLPFGVFVVGLSLVLLVMVFRSIAVPVKAAVGYLLSLGAALGATTLVFVDGFGADQLGIARTGSVVSFLPIILMAVLFGLAMDYEVFLVSRMAEAHSRGRDPATAIREGFTKSAPVVTAAAVIMVGVFVAFVPADDATIKPIAFALAVGVAVDAFIVRLTLVPAVLALLGRHAWELPAWLDNRLPTVDAEGQALEHQLRLVDWPEGHPDDIVSVGDLVVRDHDGHPVTRVEELHLTPGTAAVLVGEYGLSVLHALTGRRLGFTGDVKVSGRVLPQEAGILRRTLPLSVGSVTVTHDADLVAVVDLEDALLADPAAAQVLRDHLDAGGCVLATSRTSADASRAVAEALPDATAVTIIDPAVADLPTT